MWRVEIKSGRERKCQFVLQQVKPIATKLLRDNSGNSNLTIRLIKNVILTYVVLKWTGCQLHEQREEPDN